MLTPSPNPALSLELPQLTTSSIAHPDTWNPTHQALLDNDAALHQLTEAIQQAQQQAESQLTERLDTLETVSAVGTQRAVTLDWLYRRNTIQFELWQPGFTLTDPVDTGILSALAGDDSLDLDSTAGVKAGESYLLSIQGKPTHLVKVISVLSEHRVRIEHDLPVDYTGGQLQRTTMAMNAGGALAQPGDRWLSRKIHASNSSSVIIRMQLNAANVRLFWRDDTRNWTESIWTARRAIENDPGYSDFEYNVGGTGNCWLRLDVEGEPVTIKHLVVLGENTGLGGFVNQAAKPLPPSIAWPIDQGTDTPIQPTLSINSYQSVSGIALAGVRFQLASDAEFTTVVHDSGYVSSGLSYAVPDSALQHGESYYLRARVKDNSMLESEWGATVFFTVEDEVALRFDAPRVIAPANNGLDVEQFFTIRLSLPHVSSGVGELAHSATRVQIRQASANWSQPLWDSGTLGAVLSVEAPGGELAPDTTYVIRAAYQADGEAWSEWSPDSAFTTVEQFASSVTGVALVPQGIDWGAVRIDEGYAQLNAPLKQAYFDNHPVFGGIYDALIHGQHMVRIPKFYYRRAMISLAPWQGQVDSWLISPTPQAGFSVHPAFIRDGIEQDEFFVGKYVCGLSETGVLQSVPGVMPATNTSTNQTPHPNHTVGWGNSWTGLFSSRVDPLNTDGVTGFDLWNLHALSAIQMLYIVENCSFDSQAVTGRGHVDGYAPDAVDAPSVLAASYRGIIGLWGNIHQVVSGSVYSRATYPTDVVAGSPFLQGQDVRAAFVISGGRIANDIAGIAAPSGATQLLVHGGQYNSGETAGIVAANYLSPVQFSGTFGYRLVKYNA